MWPQWAEPSSLVPASPHHQRPIIVVTSDRGEVSPVSPCRPAQSVTNHKSRRWTGVLISAPVQPWNCVVRPVMA
ncbi:hypothetical protein RRG08_031826 [Elysia crispata]|uniref:Uncharacterized protein n=1 Tax=Elysia crispata TaxID=231223 RepID=A0AAE1CT26_9GAST|nr:hypothetical protein RRG08_031826 [Elysia crispata]